MKTWLPLVFLACLADCAAASIPSLALGPLNDQLFAAPSQPIRVEDVFALSDSMQRYVRTELAAQTTAKGAQRGLFDALYGPGQLKLDYDATMTRNAAQAFEKRSGNCLSLAIMTAAFAKELGLRVRFHKISVDEAWSRSGHLVVLDEHVNVSLGVRQHNGPAGQIVTHELTIDFVPIDNLKTRRTRELSEQTIIAMYMSNRAAELLAQRRLDDAYAFARTAIAQDPGYIAAWNTLGVIYKAHGNLQEARATFEGILGIEPKDAIALSNLVLVLKALGESTEAQALADRLERIRPYPPFHFYDLGLAAMDRGDFVAAKALLLTEIDRDPYYDKSHFQLALAYYRLGDPVNAGKQLAIAAEVGKTGGDRDLYAAKLARLNASPSP